MTAEETRKKMLVFIMGITQTYQALVKYDEKKAHDYEEMLYPQRILVDKVGYDKILVLGTKDALKKHYASFKKYIRKQGYKDVSIERFVISKLSNHAEFWNTFRKFSRKFDKMNIENEWDIDVDLTNGYRSQPMFILEIIRFFCNMNDKKCYLGHQHYGSFDNAPQKRTSSNQAEAPSQISSQGKTDYYDMTTISELADMARDINDFLKYSQADGLINRLDMLCQKMRKKTAFCQQIKSIMDSAKCFSSVVTMNISPSAADVIKELLTAIDQLEERKIVGQSGALYPFVMAMKNLKKELEKHLPVDRNPLWGWQLALCKWCLERKLYQQAATQAEELVTTRFSEEYEVKVRGKSPEKAAKSALKYDGIRKKMGLYVGTMCKNYADTSEFHKSLHEAIDHNGENAIVKIRNRINHAYMSKKTGDIMLQEEKLVSCVKKIIDLMDHNEIPDNFFDEYSDFQIENM